MSTRERSRDGIQLRSGRGNVWGDNSGLFDALNMPRCWIVYTGTATIANAGDATITFDTAVARLDTDGFWPGSGQRATVRTAGLYHVIGRVNFAANAAGNLRAAWLQKNAVTATRYGQDFRAGNAAQPTTLTAADQIQLDAGDYVELHCFQDSGGALAVSTIGATTPSAELKLCLIST